MTTHPTPWKIENFSIRFWEADECPLFKRIVDAVNLNEPKTFAPVDGRNDPALGKGDFLTSCEAETGAGEI